MSKLIIYFNPPTIIQLHSITVMDFVFVNKRIEKNNNIYIFNILSIIYYLLI